MSVVPLTVEITVICCVAAILLHRYGNWRKQHLLVTLATFIAWYFSLMIVFILPLDVSLTCYRQCLRDQHHHSSPARQLTTPGNKTNITITTSSASLASFSPTSASPVNSTDSYLSNEQPSSSMSPEDVCQEPLSYVPPYILPTLWHVVYWTSQVLTWLVLPMMQSYANAGDFTVTGKIKRSLFENAIYYGTYLLIFGVCLIYLAVKGIQINGAQLKVIGITASNTWGLFLLVLLLGYGLVDIPRTCWNNAKHGYRLSHTEFKIAKLSTEKTEAEETLEDVLDDVKKAAETIRSSHPLRQHVETMLQKCPESVQKAVERTQKHRTRTGRDDEITPTETPTYKSLVRLHQKLIKALQTAQRTEVQWTMLMEEAFDLEDVQQNERNTNRKFVRSMGKYDGIFRRCYSSTIEWYWKCRLYPYGLRVLSVLLIAFSFMVVWSECLFFIKKPVLSLFAIYINLAKANYDYLYIELISMTIIAYLCICAYYTVFKVRILNYYYIAAHHQTSEKSLMFSGMMLCRLTPPLCLNFLGMIHMDSHVIKSGKNMEETAYTQIMGHMDVIKFISNGINIYLPMLIVLLCVATYFHLGGRCLQFLGFQQFIGDDDMTQELMDEGKQLIQRERRKRQRWEDGQSRRRDWQERFGESSSRGQAKDSSDSEAGGSRWWRGGSNQNFQARSPTENDRTELLKEAEPIDYTSDTKVDVSHGFSINNTDGNSSYQQRPGGYTTSRTAAKPPRGIFDDI